MKKTKEKKAKIIDFRRKRDVYVSTEKKDGGITEKKKTEKAEKENREHKDSVFVDLFYEDETAEKNLLSLYNALHDTDYRNEEVIHKVRIEKVLYKNFKNDISFEMNGKVLVFGEHQSTVNANMPLRCLMYVGRAYELLVDKKARYKTQTVRIPAPEFYTFYNGTDEFPLEKELSLSDAFIGPAEGSSIDLKVKVININTGKAHNILKKCRVLREYSQFIDMVRKYADEEASIRRAINECIARGILADYLKRKGSEVTNMLIAEYSYEEDIEVKQQEAMQIGEKRGEKNGMILSGKIFQAIKKKPELTNLQIAEEVGCTVEDVRNVRKMFEI